jgi:HAD superfamily hydrolase (TIGR01549 family)
MTTPAAIPRAAEVCFDPPPRLVLFDLDNTLCDYDGARVIRTRYAFMPCFDDAVTLEQAVVDAVAQAEHGAEHFAGVLAAHGLDDAALVAAAQARYSEDLFRGLRLYDESLAVVAAVARVAQIGMITNGPADIQRPKIELLELAGVFPLIIVSGEVGVWKPDPAIFRLALERANVAAGDALYVGDSPEHDMQGARAAGLGCVWINRAGYAWPGGAPPDVEIRDLRELLPVLGLEGA